MTAPSLTVQQNGLLQVSGDNYNTYAQTCNIVADLRGFIGVSGVQVYMRGYTAIGDGGQGWFYWNASGIAADDAGVTTVVPNGAATGEWTRITDQSALTLYNTVTPQGRLSLVSGVPVQLSDQTAKTSIFYTPYVGSMLPILSGSNFIAGRFSELTLTLNASAHLSGSVYDIFAFLNSGVATLGSGPAWSTTASRGTGAGTTQISQTQGLQVNTNSITLKNGTTTYAGIGIGQAIYLGTFYATANGQTGAAFKPSGAAGGSANIIGLWNAYNRVKTNVLERDSTASWTYATASWRAMDGNTNNSISILDGLAQTPVKAYIQNSVFSSTAGNTTQVGINLNSTSAAPNIKGVVASPTATAANNFLTQYASESFYPSLGFNVYTAMEIGGGATGTLNTNSTYAFIIDTEY